MISKRQSVFCLISFPRLSFGRFLLFSVLICASIVAAADAARAQGNYAIWGEVKISGDPANVPSGITVILYKGGGAEYGRQNVSNRSRYRFTNLGFGEYDVVVEANENEVARARINILDNALSPFYGFRQDFEFELKARAAGPPGTISAADMYSRSAANQALFRKAEEAAGKKKYDEAARFLQSILDSDKADFQVWTLLGTVYLVQEKLDDAEKAYVAALAVKPTFAKALVHLGKVRSTQKRFEEAIDPLTRALEGQPESGELNLLLGEAYLQTKKGSKAVPYLNEAARLGRPEAHLRLAWLYNAAGLKEKAVTEYEEFLKKKPDYADRKKLEDYIVANKKS